MHRDLVPAIWLPDPHVREERELARFRLHLIKHCSMLKHRVHSTVVNFGRPCPVTDLFGVEGSRLLARLDAPEPWRGNVAASVAADRRPGAPARPDSTDKLKAGHADHPCLPLLLSAPGIGRVLAFTIAAEIGEIERFASPAEARRLHRPLPAGRSVGRLRPPRSARKARPRYLRWALLEATMHALSHPAYPSATSATSAGSASSAAPRSPRSTSPAAFATRSGACSRVARASLREAPLFVWRPDRPFGLAPERSTNFA